MNDFRFLKPLAAACAGFVLCTGLSGCWMIYTTRHLPKPRTPEVVQTATADDLVEELNQRWRALQTLTATVEVQATTSKDGLAKDYTTFPANILLQTPRKLRVYGRVPVLNSELFDMSSDGQTVTMYIPRQNKAYRGPVVLRKKSDNQYMNIRPGFFIDALIVRGLEPDDYYSVTADTETVEDAQKKHLYSVPEYILSITRQKPGTRQLIPVRVITFHREDLLPYEQDIYDANGNLETHVSYQAYQDFGSGRFPSVVTIKRPLEGNQIVLYVEKINVNMHLNDDQFIAKVPSSATMKELE